MLQQQTLVNAAFWSLWPENNRSWSYAAENVKNDGILIRHRANECECWHGCGDTECHQQTSGAGLHEKQSDISEICVFTLSQTHQPISTRLSNSSNTSTNNVWMYFYSQFSETLLFGDNLMWIFFKIRVIAQLWQMAACLMSRVSVFPWQCSFQGESESRIVMWGMTLFKMFPVLVFLCLILPGDWPEALSRESFPLAPQVIWLAK